MESESQFCYPHARTGSLSCCALRHQKILTPAKLRRLPVSNQHLFKVIIRRLCLVFVLGLTAEALSLHVIAAEPTLEELKADLRSGEAKVRRKAASELGKTKSRDAVQPLLGAATDRDVSVREEVVKSLGLLKDQEALTMLLTTIKDPADSVREESIIALVNLYADRDAGWVVTRTAKKAYKTINPFSDQVGDDRNNH